MSSDYARKKAYFDRLLTLFGRNPVHEALMSDTVTPVRLHLALSNRPSREIEAMTQLAIAKGATVHHHSREELSRISRNRRQDQGIALDAELAGYVATDKLIESPPAGGELIAVDHVTNPQNLGMIIRTVAASPLRGLILPRKGTAGIDGLVVKASAGALFQARIFHCDALPPQLEALKSHGYHIIGLEGSGDRSISEVDAGDDNVFVLGNESRGLASDVREICDEFVRIPLENNVESLNVSNAAALVAFRSVFMS